MNKLVAFSLFCMCLLIGINQSAVAQSTKPQPNEELVVALSQDEDFNNFYLENMRFLKLKESDAISEQEEKAFHAKQKERVDNVKARFPKYAALSEKEAMNIRSRAWDIVKQNSKY